MIWYTKRYAVRIRGWGRTRNLADTCESATQEAEKSYAVTFTPSHVPVTPGFAHNLLNPGFK